MPIFVDNVLTYVDRLLISVVVRLLRSAKSTTLTPPLMELYTPYIVDIVDGRYLVWDRSLFDSAIKGDTNVAVPLDPVVNILSDSTGRLPNPWNAYILRRRIVSVSRDIRFDVDIFLF